MDVIGKEFSLTKADKDYFVRIELKKLAFVLGFLMVVFVVIIFAIQLPFEVISYFFFGCILLFIIMISLRSFAVKQQAEQYRFKLLDQGILRIYLKDSAYATLDFLREVHEGQTGQSGDQFIEWERLSKIRITDVDMIFYDKKHSLFSGEGIIELPKQLSFYPEVKAYIDAFYGHLIQKN